MGTGSGDLTSCGTSGGGFTIDSATNSGAMSLTSISADNNITISLDGGDRGHLAGVNAGDALTISQADASSGTFADDGFSEWSSSVTVGSGAAGGAGNMTVSGLSTASSFSFTARRMEILCKRSQPPHL